MSSGRVFSARLASLGLIAATLLAACDAGESRPAATAKAASPGAPRARPAEGAAGRRTAPGANGEERPSIVVIVMDTVRADAVSAYGAVKGTTPVFDALSAEGTLYTRAFAPSGWTLPSHATLLTGLGVERHGVGVRGREALDDSFVTIAARLGEAGYQTAGFSENMMVSQPFGLARGFERFSAKPIPATLGPQRDDYDVLREVSAWTREVSDSPFFLFVNLFDAHSPYDVRDENPFLPKGVHVETARAIQHPERGGIALSVGICDRLPPRDERAILRGLYLGDVHEVDRKLGRILELLNGLGRRLVTVVTADHGEHLGEHALMGHEFTVWNAALHVPLVVHGASGIAAGRSNAPVTLSDVSASILAWAGVDLPEDLDGRPLPRPGEDPPERTLFAVYSDGPWEAPEGVTLHPELEGNKRASCRPEHRVFGDLYATTRFPFKLIETPGQPPALFDLSWDPGERSNLAKYRPRLVAELRSAMREFRARTERLDAGRPDPEATERLRSLGYLD